MKKLSVILMALIMTASLAACGDNGGEISDNSSSISSQAGNSGSNESSSGANIDLSNPSVVVELGDFDAIEKLAKDMQNFAVEENTVQRLRL